MIEQGSRFSELKELRRQFGEGPVGSIAFRMIVKNSPCEAKINEDNSICGQSSIMTADLDVPFTRDLEMKPVCGEEHYQLVVKEMNDAHNKWSQERGYGEAFLPAPGRNGRVRGISGYQALGKKRTSLGGY